MFNLNFKLTFLSRRS